MPNFDPSTLPLPVRDAFGMDPFYWPILVQRAIPEGITDVDRLTSIVFYMHHKDRHGRPIASWEQPLIKEWKAFRALISPMVTYKPKSSPKSPTPVPGGGVSPTDSEAVRAETLAQLERMKLDGTLTEKEYTWAAGVAKTVLTTADDVASYTGLAMDLADLIPFIPLEAATLSATGLTAFGITTGVLALAAPFLQFIGFAYLLSESMETDLRMYGAVAVAYSITAWAFGETTNSSPTLRKRLTDPGSHLYGRARTTTELDEQWRKSREETRVKMIELCLKVGKPHAKRTIQAVLRAEGKKKLSKAALVYMATKMKPIPAENLRRLALELSYPA